MLTGRRQAFPPPPDLTVWWAVILGIATVVAVGANHPEPSPIAQERPAMLRSGVIVAGSGWL